MLIGTGPWGRADVVIIAESMRGWGDGDGEGEGEGEGELADQGP